MSEAPTVAVVGAGIAGLTAAHALSRRRRVVLYEAAGRLGGHAHTHDLAGRGGNRLQVDSGFIVYNERTYPLFTRLLRELGVATQDAEMSLSVRCDGCGLQYAGGRGPVGLFAQPRQMAHPRFLRMLAEVPAFHRRARRLLTTPAADGDPTLAQFLAGRHSDYFVAHLVTPLVASVWSSPPATAMRYPARYLFHFLANHGMLSVSGSPTWKTITGGSQEYVQRIAQRLDTVYTDTPVHTIRRVRDGAEVTATDGSARHYDAVVVATHPDQALTLLDDPTSDERRVLSGFGYSLNPALLHSDTSLLPTTRAARASWNYFMPTCQTPPDRVQVSYDLNRLQRLDTTRGHVVTLNGEHRVQPEQVITRMTYEHPTYTAESLAAQRQLPDLNTHTTAYAGAYHGWGFHEDGCRSGVAAARALGVTW